MQNNIKKSKAILYFRVSENEKSNKGINFKSQEDQLLKYCAKNNIEVVEIIKENCSAKDFASPAWKRMLNSLRNGTLKADQLLFITWDRFSRNVEAACSMIDTLCGLRVIPQAIEQKIDFSVSEQFPLLAIYLCAPAIDSLRRSKSLLPD